MQLHAVTTQTTEHSNAGAEAVPSWQTAQAVQCTAARKQLHSCCPLVCHNLPCRRALLPSPPAITTRAAAAMAAVAAGYLAG